jgi:SAM-dependent methyltransferase
MTAVGTENLEQMAEAENYNAFLLKLARRIGTRGQRILDFGAGIGTFAHPLSTDGIFLTCVEPDAPAREHLLALGLEAHASIDTVQKNSMDGIYSFNVLEHVPDDDAVLRDLFARLRAGGRLMLYVPAFLCLFSAMDRRVGHLRRYRAGDLIAKVQRAGFKIDRARYVDSLGFFVTLAYRMFGDRDGGINRGALRFYDQIIFPVSRILDPLLGRALGKNLLIEARKD